MAKSQKEKKTVKKKKKAVARRKKTVASTKKSVPGRTAAAGIIASRQQALIDADQSEFKLEDFADVSQESASIISVVKGLEEQVETAFKLKEVLEAELDTTQKRLAEELDARSQLEAQVELLQMRAAQVEQLREDVSFAEQERNKFANLLSHTQPQLEQAITDCDSLTEQLSSAEANIKELEGEKMALEAHVMNLKDRVADTNHLRGELAEMTEANQDLREQLHNMTRCLESTETSKDAIEKELDRSHQSSRKLQEELEAFREKIAASDNLLTDTRIELEDQQAVNKELMETNTRLESELEMLNINYEATRNVLNASKNALREIRSEATQTSGRVRQRYFKAAPTKA
jgi:CAP-Gly domain-containing linker protein 1